MHAPPGQGPVAVAFSGGLDSTVLLHRLAADAEVRARGLRALHVDHGLHPDAPQWAAHCERACVALGVPLHVLRVQVRPDGDGLEAAARNARYAAFADTQHEGEVIALAHHRDDQAETVLLRLLRGAGDGLAAMRPQRPFGRGWLWRPLLDTARARLLAEARAAGFAWIDDPSNADPRHDRNLLRHVVLPRLRARWPQAPAALARSAALIASQADLLAGEDDRRLAQLQGVDPATLSLPGLLAQPPAWRDRLLRAWLARLGLPPLPTDALATIATDVLVGRADAAACFAWRGVELRRWRDRLWAGAATPALPRDWRVAWHGDTPLALPGGGELVLSPPRRFDTPLHAHARQGGERLHLPGRTHSTELKPLLQSLGVPPWLRPALPLLSDADGHLLAAGDVAVAAPLQTWLHAHDTCLRHHAGAR